MSDTTRKIRPLLAEVVSDKMQKSRVAVVKRLVKHNEFGKYVKQTTRLMFHDENNLSVTGDKVLIAPSRPHSARKRFDLVEVLNPKSGSK